ncbi:MAG: hypothetical protein ACXAC7_23895 [Candidatus Hodarchaeales archaeon]|jgi:hypothetical protein
MSFIREKPKLIRRLSKGLKFGLNTLLILFTLATGIIGTLAITGTVFTLNFIVYVAISILIISIIVTFFKGQLEHLPDQIIFDDKIDKEYTATYCTVETLAQANSITKPYYGHEYISNEKAEGWRQKSPNSFIHILNKKGKLCASFGIIIVENSFFSQFIKGRLTDNELEPDDILNDESIKKSNNLYISGVVVKNPDTAIGKRRAVVMVWAMLKYLQHLYGLRKERNIYALAVSKSSENLLNKSGFKVISEASERKDKLNLYHLKFCRDSFNNILTRIGNCSSFCQLIY